MYWVKWGGHTAVSGLRLCDLQKYPNLILRYFHRVICTVNVVFMAVNEVEKLMVGAFWSKWVTFSKTNCIMQ